MDISIINVSYNQSDFFNERGIGMRKISKGRFIFALMLPLIIGIISAALSSQGMMMYGSMDKPPLSPPAWVFSVAWTILYLMMGAASYLILVSGADIRSRKTAMILYVIQLFMNFMWSILFFNWQLYLFALIWLLIMWGIVIICALKFKRISRTAAWLMVPYILWLTFAAYLNLGAYILAAA